MSIIFKKTEDRSPKSEDIIRISGLKSEDLKVTIATGFHLFPFRTEQLSPPAPMVLQTAGE